ncbi:Cgl0159 family (beta/alpha)8-fold protein [Candidatus Lokiarchaeum ossiferum]|uniref:Cgl0159 family (beta/alpha)8-fold protein n=1 Tax=Candidatus Lokiarchaeum ossiferum TaxID=2951803 RepID=UPI00352D3DE8
MAFEKNIKSIVHFMAFPGPRHGKTTLLGEASEKFMVESFNSIKNTNYFNGIEVTTIKDPILRKKMAALYKKENFYVSFCAQPVQLINEDHLIEPTDISSINEIERSNAVDRMRNLIDEAYEIDAKAFCFLSGKDPETTNCTGDRKHAIRALILSIKEMCRYNRKCAKKLGKKPLKMTLELFDRIDHSLTKNQLIGPSSDARTVAETIKIDQGYDEFGLLYDVSHMFLIFDGGYPETVETIRSLKPFLNWVHVANCVAEEEKNAYGDLHLSMDHPDGAVTPTVLKEFYIALMDIDFEGGIALEVMPIGDQSSESVIYTGIAAMKNAEAHIMVNYAIGAYRFKTRQFLPERLFYRLTEYKIKHSTQILENAKKRKKRSYPWDSNIIIVAADHPARFVTTVGDNEVAMGDRQQYLGRIVRSLIDPKVDGIMATPDIFDDLFALDHMITEASGESLLNGRILIGCTNRGGLSGSDYEMDDQITAYTIKEIFDMNLDGAKMMFRLDLQSSQARYSQKTIIACADMVRECGKYNLPAFVEPLPVERIENKYRVKLNYVDLIKTIGVATAIGGSSSSKIWLKVPYVDNFEQVARSTSNPILLLGGASTGYPTDTIINFEKGLGAGPNIKGALAGRNLLYPGFDDPLAVTLAVSNVIHDYETAENSVKFLRTQRGRDIDYLSNLLLKEE